MRLRSKIVTEPLFDPEHKKLLLIKRTALKPGVLDSASLKVATLIYVLTSCTKISPTFDALATNESVAFQCRLLIYE